MKFKRNNEGQISGVTLRDRWNDGLGCILLLGLEERK